MSQKPVNERATRWLASNDTGASSLAIARHMLGLEHDEWGASYPIDGADFGRCFRLLELIPEWRERMPEMASYSRQWAALCAVWSDLEARHRTGKDVYDAMKAALRKPEAEDPNLIRISPGVSIRFGKIGA